MIIVIIVIIITIILTIMQQVPQYQSPPHTHTNRRRGSNQGITSGHQLISFSKFKLSAKTDRTNTFPYHSSSQRRPEGHFLTKLFCLKSHLGSRGGCKFPVSSLLFLPLPRTEDSLPRFAHLLLAQMSNVFVPGKVGVQTISSPITVPVMAGTL